MALNKNSNAYTVIYTVVMVVIVGALLATLATVLKPMQEDNVLNEQKESIMKAFGAEGESFDKVTVGAIVGGTQFVEVKKDADIKAAFELISNRKALAAEEDALPIFMYEKAGETLFVVPIVGKGLWNDIWGYVALKPVAGNMEVVGIIMDHAGETPGLGAEIATDGVQGQFAGKQLYANGEFALKMLKNGKDNRAYIDGCSVDAISGGTKTCDGVNSMLENSLKKYAPFFATSLGVHVNVNIE